MTTTRKHRDVAVRVSTRVSRQDNIRCAAAAAAAAAAEMGCQWCCSCDCRGLLHHDVITSMWICFRREARFVVVSYLYALVLEGVIGVTRTRVHLLHLSTVGKSLVSSDPCSMVAILVKQRRYLFERLNFDLAHYPSSPLCTCTCRTTSARVRGMEQLHQMSIFS